MIIVRFDNYLLCILMIYCKNMKTNIIKLTLKPTAPACQTRKKRNMSFKADLLCENQQQNRLEDMKSSQFIIKQSLIEKQYGKFGPNCIIYIGLLDRVTFFMMICSIFVAFPLLVLNLQQNNKICPENKNCLQFYVFNSISIFNISDNSTYLKIQMYFWLGVCIFVWLYSIYLRIYTVKTYQRVNNSYDNEGDYGIIIRSLPSNLSDDEYRMEIEEKFVKIILKNQIKKRWIKLRQKTGSSIDYQKMDKQIEQLLQINKMLIPQVQTSQQSQIHVNEKYRCLSKKQKKSTAIIIFHRIQANDQIHEITTNDSYQTALGFLLPVIFQSCTRTRKQIVVKDQMVIVNRAPSPNDIIWQNYDYSPPSRNGRIILLTITSLVVIAISAAVYFFVYKLQKWINFFVLTTIMVIISTGFNIVLQIILNKFVTEMKFLTSTQEISNKMLYKVIFQSINQGIFNIMIPYLAELPNVEQGLSKANFPTFMVTTMLIQLCKSIIQFVITYKDVEKNIIKCLMTKNIICLSEQKKKQMYAQANEIPFSSKQAKWIKLYWLGLVFGIVSPICVLISFMALLLDFFGERFLFKEKYLFPNNTRISCSLTFINLFQNVPILIGVLNLIYHKTFEIINRTQIQSEILNVIKAILIVGVVFALLPWDQILQRFKINIRSNPDKNYDLRKQYFQTTYQKQYETALEKFRNAETERNLLNPQN